jgi:hypothetical protein
MDPTPASIKLTYSFGSSNSEIVILSKTISTDVEKKIFDYYYSELSDKIAATKMSGLLKVFLDTISL